MDMNRLTTRLVGWNTKWWCLKFPKKFQNYVAKPIKTCPLALLPKFQHHLCLGIQTIKVTKYLPNTAPQVGINKGAALKARIQNPKKVEVQMVDWWYKQIAILRRQYHIILTASWEKIYGIYFLPTWYCHLKTAISFVSRSIIYKDK